MRCQHRNISKIRTIIIIIIVAVNIVVVVVVIVSVEALMEQALIGPSPNPLILSYLKYAISSQVSSHLLVLQLQQKIEIKDAVLEEQHAR